MRDPLIRLYRTKLTLLATIFVAAGTLLILLARAVSRTDSLTWLHFVPFGEFGGTLLTAGLFGVLLYYLDQQDADERATERLDKSLKRAAPAIREAVVRGFAFQPEALKEVASPELLDRIAINALALRLQDSILATEAYTDLRDQIIRAPERWYDVRASVALAPRAASKGVPPLFVATVRWEYRVTPGSPSMRFACVSDRDEYRELLHDQSIPAIWYFPNAGELDASSTEAFELVQFAVNGQTRAARRTSRKGSQLYSVGLEEEFQAGREVTISFTYRVLVRQAGHLLFVEVPRPAKGLHVQFWYGDTGIHHVDALDFIASTGRPRIVRTPATAPTPSIDIGFDGWVFPRAGVAFVWALQHEVSAGSATGSAVDFHRAARQ